ncbi:MAG: hypothetical protein HRU24_09125 [Gammaproteobacteria bacterium]|nr:hypothetical protein [Gammaproteobacteria bacterium]
MKHDNALIKRLIFANTSETKIWFELTIICAISVYFWINLHHDSSRQAEDYFFWPMLGPLVIALRYGFAKAIQCILLCVLSVLLLVQLFNIEVYFSLYVGIGAILVIMIAGEFSDYWQTITKKYELNHRLMEQKIQSFTQNYHLLKISHDQLEQRAAGQLMSLRTGIQILQQAALSKTSQRLDKLGGECLHILSDIIGMYQAGIYEVKNDQIITPCISSIGQSHILKINDPMLQDMLLNKKVLTPSNIFDTADNSHYYQLTIPLVDASGTLQGIVIAEKIKFVSLTKSNIALVALLASYMGNLMCDKLQTSILLPHQKSDFERYFSQLQWNKNHYGIDSSLILFVDKKTGPSVALNKFIDYRRGADIFWSCYTPQGHQAMVALLPMATTIEAQQFTDRLMDTVAIKDQLDIGDIDISGPFDAFEQYDIVTQLLRNLGEDDDEGEGEKNENHTDNHNVTA